MANVVPRKWLRFWSNCERAAEKTAAERTFFVPRAEKCRLVHLESAPVPSREAAYYAP